MKALAVVATKLEATFGLPLVHERNWMLKDVVTRLRKLFPTIDFHYFHEKSSMRPDGGILSVLDKDDGRYPVLIVEVKNQGTNDLRKTEGLPAQAKGNAIERLGKNVIGFRTAMMNETIIPFVCFGDGCDFQDSSSILDRVVTIAMFGKLNTIHLTNEGDNAQFNRGSFFFREAPWTSDEMADVMWTIAERSVFYYFSKYGKEQFRRTT